MVALEHFYVGQLVHYGVPKGETRVLARTKSLNDDLISTAQSLYSQALLPNAPRTSWTLLRGNRDVPFLIVHAQRGDAGNVTQHYILLTGDVQRSVQGNVKAYLALIPEKLPTFEMLVDIMPANFDIPAPPTTAQQADTLLDLMTYTRNNTRALEPLLSAVVQGRTLFVINAPTDVDARLGFVQGLLTLLPPSTRFSVTFALYASPSANGNAQIVFTDGDVSDPKASVYDWQTGKTSNTTENDYSRFIISQLRLDAELAVQQADTLTNTAGWRFKSGDTLAGALAYASHRSKVDQSVLNNLPVEAKDVSQILADDPTLDDNMRVAYANHLIKFSIALEDTSYTDPVALTCGKFPTLAKSVHQMFMDALRAGKATLVFQTLARWMENPLAPQSPEWIDLLNRAALADLRDIVQERDAEGLKLFIGELQNMQSAHLVNRIVPKVIEVSVPLASEDAQLPSQILLLGMTYLDRPALRRLMTVPDLVKYLPREIKRFLAALASKEPVSAPNIVLEAAQQLGDDHKDEAIMQFADIAHATERTYLIDAPTLAEMARIATTPRGGKYLSTVLNVARHISDERVEKMPEEAARAVLQLFLVSRRYDLLAKAMIEQSKHVYGGERQQDYVKSVQAAFAATPLSVEDLRKAISTLRELYIKEVPLMCAMCGALEAARYAPELNDYAQEVTRELSQSTRYVQVVHHEAPLALLKHYLQQGDVARVKQVALLMPKVAEEKDDRDSLLAIRETYRLLNAHEAHQTLAFETLRHYVRIANPKPAQRIVEYYGKELGNPFASKLQRALEFSTFTHGLSLESYADTVRVTADLLQSLYEAFYKDRPKPRELDALIENLRVRIDRVRQPKLAVELLRFNKAVLQLGRGIDAKQLTPESISAVAKGGEAPRSIVEVFRCAGGHLLKGKVVAYRPKPASDTSKPFGEVQIVDLYDTFRVINEVLRKPLQLFPSKVTWTAKQIADELDSYIAMSYGDSLTDTIQALGTDWQRLAELLPLLAKDADPSLGEENTRAFRALEDLQQAPKNPLELCRYIYGYLKG